MSRFPAYNYLQVVRKIRKLGFVFDRPTRGSHELWYNPKTHKRVLIPRHPGKTIKRKTLKSIIQETDLTPEEFTKI